MAGKLESSEEPKRLYGFLDSVDLTDVQGDGLGRTDLTFEAVDAAAFDSGDAQARGVEHLSMVRVL